MSWQHIFPEGSIVVIGRESYTAKHNPHFPGIDLYQGGERVMTVCPDWLPQIATGTTIEGEPS
jgi:hypothetical protein